MNTRHNLIRLILLGMLLLGLPELAKAQTWYEYQDSDGYYEYTINSDGTITIVDSGLVNAPVTIPQTMNGLTVSAIGDNGCGADAMTSVTIPGTVTSIGDSAFFDCRDLTSIFIPASVTSIGPSAFMDCYSLTSITLPYGVTDLDGTFWGCTSLTSVTIPSSVTTIDDFAFFECTNLANIDIPNNVTNINFEAFEGCTSLTDINIPGNVIYIDVTAFQNCNSLQAYTVDANNPDYSSVNGVLFDKNQDTLIAYPPAKAGTSYVFPNTVTNIAESAFSGCINLTSIAIPERVTSMGAEAFSGCTGLTSITVPGSVSVIPGGAFSDCTGLTNVIVSSGITNIGSSAFSSCSNLVSILLPNTVNFIGNSAFNNCASLASIAIPYGVTSLGSGVYQVRFSIGFFQNCYSLTNVIIPATVTNIGPNAFAGCSNLTSIIIPNSVVSIGGLAFADTGLTNLVIPASVTNIQNIAFENCPGLATVYFLGNAPIVPPGIFSGDTTTLYYVPGTTGWAAFASATGLTPEVWPTGGNIFQDTFDPTIASGYQYYSGGDCFNSSVNIVAGAGTGGSSALQIQTSFSNGPNGYGYYASQWQDNVVSGNTDTNLSHYVLSFDAMVTGDASHQSGGGFSLQIQEGAGQYFSTPFPQGQLLTYQPYQGGADLIVPKDGVWQHFAINLGGPTFQLPNGTNLTFNPAGGTWQINFQINADDWGVEPQTNSTLLIDNLTLSLGVPPGAQFVASPTNVLAGASVQFTCPSLDTGANSITNWNWNFGDGTSSTNENPAHVYASPGTFTPILFVNNANGTLFPAAGPSVNAFSVPALTSTHVSAGNLLINGTNGISGLNYYVLASTNPALPFNDWTPVATNEWNASGNFILTVTNAVKGTGHMQFYIVKIPAL